MLKRFLTVGAVTLALLPAVAAADPVTVGTLVTTNGGSVLPAPSGGPGAPLVGLIVNLPTAGASAVLQVSGLAFNTDYVMGLMVFGAGSS